MRKLKLSTKPYIYNVDNVNIIRFMLLYPVKAKSKYLDTYKLKLVSRIVSNSSKKYNTIDVFEKTMDRNLVIKYYIEHVKFDEELFIVFNYVIPKEGLVSDYNIEQAIELLHECIYNPSILNNKFTKELFDWNKGKLLNDVRQEINSLYELTRHEVNSLIDPKHKITFSREEKIKLVEKTSASNIYEYYKKNVLNNKFVTFIYGRIEDKKRISDLYNKYFKQRYYDFDMNIHLYNFLPYKNYKYRTIKTKYNQSAYCLVYQVVNCKIRDVNKLQMLYYFLRSSENNLIFNKLRNENNLVYESNVLLDKTSGLLEINVLMDKKDKDLIGELIKEVINSLYDKKVFDRCKKNLMISLNYDLLDDEDNDFYYALHKINKKVKGFKEVKEIICDMNKIEYNDMKELLNRLKVGRELFLEGGYNEEDL